MADQRLSAARTWAVVLLVALAPLLLLGGVLTVSLYGAFFGVPLLLVTVPPTRWAWQLARADPGRPDRRLRTWTLVLAGGVAIALAGAIAVGRDDLDTALDLAALVGAVLWISLLITAAVGVGGRLRSDHG